MHQESKPSPTTRKLVVTGDAAIDWLQWKCQVRQDEGEQNWLAGPVFKMVPRPGGSLLLAKMVEAATNAQVIGQEVKDLSDVSSEDVLHSMAEVGVFSLSNLDKDQGEWVYRVERFEGYSGPRSCVLSPLTIGRDIDEVDVVVLDDGGNGFRDRPEVWPSALDGDSKPLVIVKMNRPLAEGPLWERLVEENGENLITVVNANSLRLCGINISRRLSWERTAQDFEWHAYHDPMITQLMRSRYLVVMFGIEGAILCHKDQQTMMNTLYYDPMVMEDDYKDDWPGQMQGLTSAFVSALTARLFHDEMEGIGKGVQDGLAAARRLFLHGYGSPPDEPDYLLKEIFESHLTDPLFTSIDIPSLSEGGGQHWTILDELAGEELEEIAYKLVIEGAVSPMIRVPVASFGELRTVDRTEIESYKSIMNLLDEYLSKRDVTTPLSIAVFGQPGSGKTYGVTQISKSIQPDKIEKLEFNVSQFRSLDDLVNAFHKVQSTGLEGKIPLVFFDEFDCFYGQRKGWLKYFLAPMQDGIFRDGETFHPIGKSIFVFAGGTSHTFEDFFTEYTDENEFNDMEEARHAWEEWDQFCEAKGPDFVSRLRGYVNIMGINPANKADRCYMIRRAMILRSILRAKAGHIFDKDGKALIDQGVIRALIKVRRYKHGVRSMEAVIDMSLLSDRQEFEPAALPPKDQLYLHVDADHFLELVLENE
jgi:hypothetical protein